MVLRSRIFHGFEEDLWLIHKFDDRQYEWIFTIATSPSWVLISMLILTTDVFEIIHPLILLLRVVSLCVAFKNIHVSLRCPEDFSFKDVDSHCPNNAFRSLFHFRLIVMVAFRKGNPFISRKSRSFGRWKYWPNLARFDQRSVFFTNLEGVFHQRHHFAVTLRNLAERPLLLRWWGTRSLRMNKS